MEMICARTRVITVEQPSALFRRIVVAGADLNAASPELVGLPEATVSVEAAVATSRERVRRTRPLAPATPQAPAVLGAPPGTCGLHGDCLGCRPRRDAYIKLLVPPPGRGPVDLDLSDGFREAFFARPESERGWMRTYTVRAAGLVLLDGALVPSLTLDVALHGQPGDPDEGPGLRWSRTVRPGDEVNVVVPGRQDPAWSAWKHTGARQVLAVGDETAAPALVSVAEELADPFGDFTGVADIVFELPAGGELADLLPRRMALPEPWVPASSGVAGTSTPGLLLHHPSEGRIRVHVGTRAEGAPQGSWAGARVAALLGLGEDPTAAQPVPPPEGEQREWTVAEGAEADPAGRYVFLAGESAMVRGLRRLCVNEAQVPKRQVSFMGYWRQGQAES